jgi:NAD(P)-dependent dehydrogenase (short-subunit alcohol dehydrogenase family)
VALASREFAIVVSGRQQRNLDETVAAVEAVGGQAMAVAGDMGNESDVERVFETSLSRFGPCSALVNAAGVHGRPMPLVDVSLEQWEEVMHANLRATFLSTRAALRQMLPAGTGSVIFVASAGINRGFPGATPYSAAKSALIGLSHTLAAEVGPSGVRVNVISPGAVPTTYLYQYAVGVIAEERQLSVEELNQMTADMSALRRLCSAEEIASAVVFLATADSSAVTAQQLIVDAGLTL